MLELITDRAQYHVSLLNRLRKKPWSSMTVSERTAWNGDAAKGGYNYTDLNRVETAVGELAAELGLNLVTKTNWTLWDIPVASEMERYLGNVAAIRDACPGDVKFPTLPPTMNRLTFEGANNIEQVLRLVDEELHGGSVDPDIPGGDELEHRHVLGEFILGECTLGEGPSEVTDSTIRSGDIYCGEVL